eukprot:scaffold6241_cov129-Cylindrotheca_fusiformis.AAC.9
MAKKERRQRTTQDLWLTQHTHRISSTGNPGIMKHCLILAPFLLSSASAFTSVNRQFNKFVDAQTSLKVAGYDYHGYNRRIEDAYKAWCHVYNKTDTSRLEIFAYHFLLAEKFFGQTGAPIKLNEHADLTSSEYLSLKEKGSLPKTAKPTDYVVSETKASNYAAPEPAAPAGYGPAGAAYLEALSQGSTAIRGSGMTSYLDTVPKNSAVSGGRGMTSYLDTVNGAAPAVEDYYVPPPAAKTVYTPPAPAPAPSTPYSPATPAAPAANSGNYMDNLSASSTAGAPRGTGMTSYLDTVPTNNSVRGAGMESYLDNVGKAAPYTPFEAPTAATSAATPEPYNPPPAQAAAPYVPPPAAPAPASASTPAASSGNYMDNLSSTSAASTPRGKGMTSYLDSVQSNGTARGGGKGMTSYLDNMGAPQPSAVNYGSPSVRTPPQPAAAAPPPAKPAPATPAAPEVRRQPAANERRAVTNQAYQAPPLPPPSRNIPGAHWMDTVTPLTSYGSRDVINGNWAEATEYQAANARYQRGSGASPSLTQDQVAPDHFIVKEKETAEPAKSTQERMVPSVRRHVQETFGGGFIIT